ncbi:BsuBI/PstI family type II restriction endonuclease [Acinetobacter baumannii]|uniref:BsuBI/PstI family type II restriction endonuclease n=1 Tax=Acinetobacter baumannii TaxID=470 RepID=UPI000DA6BB26|nr:BsuBI/PstI family type II restriction endonuclease [Acinetobacter baumannii]MCZ0665156.1 BsuBI/PstI family type II restriction endonuclease [Acinetobacter baumannii]MDA3470784.1 restriction endonuclease [Acinetobacter baumannii]MDA3474562.1 restriction endonuclease [Acinetobacter baumannii]
MNSAEQKLEQAKALLEALGLPPAQYNNRSAWVFLALASLKPEDDWSQAKAPLLPTVEIMQFIREYYGQDYKPNSRETIRRQTLHQFEQARIVDRNRDDPTRATNSKDNNYSLNESILNILKVYPTGDWQEKIKEYQKDLPNLQALYSRILDKEKIPVKLPNGIEIKLSPGKHNQLHADIIHEFCPRFIGEGGEVLYIGDTASSREEGGKLMVLEASKLVELGVSPMSHDKLPDVVVYDKKRKWLFLIEAVTSHGPVSPKRWLELEAALSTCTVGKVYVTAFPHRAEFRKNAADIAWETEVWIADNPDHMIHFNGDRFLGPHENKNI